MNFLLKYNVHTEKYALSSVCNTYNKFSPSEQIQVVRTQISKQNLMNNPESPRVDIQTDFSFSFLKLTIILIYNVID